jgi:HK97 family phage major capsid protein
MPDVHSLEASVRDAFDALEEANDAIQSADSADDSVDVEALEAAFADAERNHQSAIEKLERARRVEEARSALPVAPAEDDVADVPAKRASVSVGNEPLVYRSVNEGGTTSFFADVYASRKGDPAAAERLDRHSRQAAELRVNPNSTDGTGGDFVFPVYLMAQWLKLARAGRPFANAVNQQQLPLGTDSINLPGISAGATVAKQTDGASVSSTDITTKTVTIPVNTAAGQQDFSRQLFDRTIAAGMGIDQVIFDDLARAYATTIDAACLAGTGTNEATGILNTSGLLTSTYTAGTPTLGGLYAKIADAIQQIHATRFLPPTAIVMHPRRWAFALSALDGSNRPLIVPQAGGNQSINAEGALSQVASENIVGSIQGLPVIVDSSIPTNNYGTNLQAVTTTSASSSSSTTLAVTSGTGIVNGMTAVGTGIPAGTTVSSGGGTTSLTLSASATVASGATVTFGGGQDTVLVTRLEDLYLYEDGAPRLRIFEETLSGTLQIRAQVYGYYGFTAARYAAASAKINGTGLAAPTFT